MFKKYENSKAPGPEGLPIKLMKYSTQILLVSLATRLTKYLQGNEIIMRTIRMGTY